MILQGKIYCYFFLQRFYIFLFLFSFFPGKPVEEYRRQLGAFGVSGDLAVQQLASLSGGQKSRVAFSLICMGNPNFFILDEPTNHLDIETIEALGKAIQKFKVCLFLFLLVSASPSLVSFNYTHLSPPLFLLRLHLSLSSSFLLPSPIEKSISLNYLYHSRLPSAH